MKAILCSHFCTADELELADIEEPHAGPGEAVVRVKSAALNFFDTLIIAGKYQHKPPFPFSPAAEFAGVVKSIGAGVTGVAPGDRAAGDEVVEPRPIRLGANALGVGGGDRGLRRADIGRRQRLLGVQADQGRVGRLDVSLGILQVGLG